METERVRYIYEIRNKLNGKTYVGQRLVKKGKTVETDWYMGSGNLITSAEKKYGLENFEKTIILSGNFSQDEINRFERCFIAIQRLLGKAEYNIADGGFCSSEQESPTFGKHWYTDGEINVISNICPIGFKKGMTRPDDFSERLKNGWANKPKSLRKSRKGQSSPFKGHHHTDNTKEKIRLTKKSQDYKKHWFTNGEKDIMAETCPDGFYPGRANEIKKCWYTDGEQNIFALECPEGFHRGRTNNKPSNKGRLWYTNGKENVMAFNCPLGFWRGVTKTIKRST